MLDLITNHRDLIEGRTRELFLDLPALNPALKDIEDGIPILIDQLVDTLRRKERAAAKYGGLLFARGFTVGEVVRAYGTICEAITTIGEELHVKFSNRDFEMLNRVLDVAIAASVTEYQRRRVEASAHKELTHIGSLAHELRNALSAALVTASVIRQGIVGTKGRTSDAHDRSLRPNARTATRRREGERSPRRRSLTPPTVWLLVVFSLPKPGTL
jgi:hypothetical protein